MSAIKVLETNVLHASDILYWLDGSSAENPAQMQRVAHPLQLVLSDKPTDLQLRQAPGKTALWRKPVTPIIDGEASEADKTYVVGPGFTLAGSILDPTGKFNPRTFSITAGNSAVPIPGQGLVLYPTPLGTRFGKAGGLIASLRYASDQSIVPWALLTVNVSVPGFGNQIYRAQADHRGDVLIALNRLPPLPEGVDHYGAQMSVRALLSADPTVPLNTDDLVAMDLESLSSAGSFSDPIGFDVVPGEIQSIRSASKDHLAVQPS